MIILSNWTHEELDRAIYINIKHSGDRKRIADFVGKSISDNEWEELKIIFKLHSDAKCHYPKQGASDFRKVHFAYEIISKTNNWKDVHKHITLTPPERSIVLKAQKARGTYIKQQRSLWQSKSPEQERAILFGKKRPAPLKRLPETASEYKYQPSVLAAFNFLRSKGDIIEVLQEGRIIINGRNGSIIDIMKRAYDGGFKYD